MNTGILDDSVKDYYRLLSVSKTEKNVKSKMCYDAVLLFMEDYPRKQISQILHIPLRTVSDHISHYKNPEKQEEFRKTFKTLKKTAGGIPPEREQKPS